MRFSSDHGHWELQSFPGNNQIVCSTHAFIKKELRGNGHGKAAAEQRLQDARRLGYDYMLSTARADNEPQLKIMRSLGWTELDRFWNSVTEVEVVVFGRKV